MKKKQTKITRKEAIKKFGKYAAMTAVGTFIVLNPQKSAAQSPPNPGWGSYQTLILKKTLCNAEFFFLNHPRNIIVN